MCIRDRPKGVVYHHRGAYLNSFGEIIHSAHTSASVYLWTLPMFHCNGWCTPWAVTAIGGTHVCLREVRGDVIWGLIDEHGVTHLNVAPTVISAIMIAPQRRELTSPVLVTTAGAPPSPTTILQMEQMGFGIRHVYGLTEVYGPYTVCEPQASWEALEPVSYTHLDVYKRQSWSSSIDCPGRISGIATALSCLFMGGNYRIQSSVTSVSTESAEGRY